MDGEAAAYESLIPLTIDHGNNYKIQLPWSLLGSRREIK